MYHHQAKRAGKVPHVVNAGLHRRQRHLSQKALRETHAHREQAEVRVIQIKDRVNEIKAMDFSKLSTEQRASLRSELKSDKKELKDIPVVIIPLGALIVIIVLLIILL